jgi:hypothetical protein
MSAKLMNYADWRAAPSGILSFKGRMDEVGERYKHKPEFQEENRQRLVQCGADIEEQIFSRCKIKPEDITEESAAPVIAELKNFVIK